MNLSERYDDKGTIRCLLCPHYCLIRPGKRGICGVRENSDGEIRLVTAGLVSGYGADPIEKKPLYHFRPGSVIFSAGSYGCNLRCDFCQNYHISQCMPGRSGSRQAAPGNSRGRRPGSGAESGTDSGVTTPAALVSKALAVRGNCGMAYTYNEPVIWYEYVMECARLAKEHGLCNVLVTNGYINPEPLNELIGVTDAFNIDLKAFSNEFYRRYTGASLQPVLDAVMMVAASGRHLEITTLVIPGLNDSPDDMKWQAEWIASNAGRTTPLHLSRYFPVYRRATPATPPETILRLREVAGKYLDYVYTGNMGGTGNGSDTRCPGCGTVTIRRTGYSVRVTGLTREGNCTNCGKQIISHMG